MTFTEQDYAVIREGCQRSAERIVPLVASYVQPSLDFTHLSVVDIGCGEGWFLDKFRSLGVETLMGVDENWWPDGPLWAAEFTEADLLEEIPDVGGYNLALCLEVVEHLPAYRAESFIAELCRVADYILFSAAIPGQGGQDHINEEWLSYWVGLFEDRKFVPCWDLRKDIWDMKAVEPWYRQNTVMFSNCEPAVQVLDLVHPDIFTWRVEEARRLRR